MIVGMQKGLSENKIRKEKTAYGKCFSEWKKWLPKNVFFFKILFFESDFCILSLFQEAIFPFRISISVMQIYDTLFSENFFHNKKKKLWKTFFLS